MDVLISLLEAVKDATGIQAVPFLTDAYADDLPAITYSFYRTGDTGAVATYRLLVRVHARTYEQAIGLADTVNNALVTVGDSTKSGCVVSGNGGGSLMDGTAQIPQQILYFDISNRSQANE